MITANKQDAANYIKNHRTIRPACYNEKRRKEYIPDDSIPKAILDSITGDDNDPSARRLAKISEAVKRLNEQLGIEDLTQDEESAQSDDSLGFDVDSDGDIDESAHIGNIEDDASESFDQGFYNDAVSGDNRYTTNVCIFPFLSYNVRNYSNPNILPKFIADWWPCVLMWNHNTVINCRVAEEVERKRCICNEEIRLPVHPILIG